MKTLIPLSVISFLLLLTPTLDCLAICISRTPEEIIGQSQFVIHGIVKEMKSARSEENSRFYTYVTVEVLGVFKGELGDRNEIVVRLRGSRGPDGRMSVENQPVIMEEMDVIIHTVLLENGCFVIRGCEDGAYYVDDGVVSGMSGKVNMTLGQFKEFVEEVIKQEETKNVDP